MQNVVEDWLEKTLLSYVQSSHPRALGGNEADGVEAHKTTEALPSYAKSKKSTDGQSRHATINALEEMQFDRDSLASYGLDKSTQDKIYRSYYVHCHGIHEMIRTYQGIHPEMATRMWEVFVAVFQYYDPELRQTFLNYLKENQDQKTVRVIERLTAHVDELTEENERLRNENLKLNVARTSAEYEQYLSHTVGNRLIDSLQEKVDFFKAQLYEKEKYIENLCQSLSERREASRLSETLLVQLGQQHKVILNEILSLRSIRKDLEKEKSTLKSKCLAFDKTINMLRDEVAATKDDLRQETRDHMLLQDQHQKLQQDHELLKEKWNAIQIELRDTQFMERSTHDTLLEIIKLFNNAIPELQQFLSASDQLENISKCTSTTIKKLSDQIDVPQEYKYISFKSRLPDALRCVTLQEFVVVPHPPKPPKKKRPLTSEKPLPSSVIEDETMENRAMETIPTGVEASTYKHSGNTVNSTNDESHEPKEDNPTLEVPECVVETEEEEEEDEEEFDAEAEMRNRKQYLNELVESSRVWNRCFPSFQREYFCLSQQPILHQVLQTLCKKSEDLIVFQKRVKELEAQIECTRPWPNILSSVLVNQRAQVIVGNNAYEKLMAEKLEKEVVIEKLGSQIGELSEFKDKYLVLEPKFLQLVEIYKQSVRDKKDVDALLQDARDRITMFERMEVEFKTTRNNLEETQSKLDEKEAYITYLRGEQKKLASKTGMDRRRTVKRNKNPKDGRGSFLEELRRSFSNNSPSPAVCSRQDPFSTAREAAMQAVMFVDSQQEFLAIDGGSPSFQSPPSSPSFNRRLLGPTDSEPGHLSTILRMDNNRVRGLSAIRLSTDLSAMSIDEESTQAAASVKKIDDQDLDDLETVIADASDALLASLLAISEMVQMSLEMQEQGKRIHEHYHGSGSLTTEGTLLLKCVDTVEKALKSLKDHRDNIVYDVSYTLEPTMKKEILTVLDSLMLMPQHMLQIMHYADELFDLRIEKQSLSNELEKVKLYSARERARIIKQYDEQVVELKRSISFLQAQN